MRRLWQIISSIKFDCIQCFFLFFMTNLFFLYGSIISLTIFFNFSRQNVDYAIFKKLERSVEFKNTSN